MEVYRDASGHVLPVVFERVKMMSYGFVAKHKDKAHAFRGPMAQQIVQQLLQGTAWDHNDYLIVDMPPGTSDVHLR